MAPGTSSKQRDYDYLFKLVLIGDSGVGKSCLLLRFAVSASPTMTSSSFRRIFSEYTLFVTFRMMLSLNRTLAQLV